MINDSHPERRCAGVDQLSLRSLVLGVLGACIITASSMYVALRMSALPWPTVFVAVLSMALLKALGRTTLNEINITQTAMSAGAMVAGGLAFTLPGLWITGRWKGPAAFGEHFWTVLWVAIAGVLLGTVLTWFMRRRFVVEEALPYPIGVAAAETITVGDQGGQKSALLFGTMGLAAVFTYLRDGLGWIPAAFSSGWLYSRNFFIGIWVSPMAVGIGYMIGTLYTGVWFLGALLSYLVIIPLGTAAKLFPAVPAAVAFKNTAGIGLMVGTGVGILIRFLLSRLPGFPNKAAKLPSGSAPAGSGGPLRLERLLSFLAFAAAFVLSVVAGIGPLPALLLLLGVWAASAMAATITGQTGINPMEIFAIIILLAIRLLVRLDSASAFLIAAAVAITCGYAGDLLNDYKAGQMLGTSPVAQLIANAAGGLAGAVIGALAMFAVIGQFGGVGADKGLPAGQAFAVSQMVGGIGDPLVFGVALAAGALLYLFRVPVMTLGIGMYLPFEISAVVFLGGLLRLLSDRFRPGAAAGAGNIAASGLLGGEGITGVGIAIYKMLTGG
ncbi:putative OPT family oligopeptide transporter [Hydrogenispora ethanolica]|uniref:Putative OPT family oligopeptide transporter n=1 Tax=Hydrogenispora ethanolica TaxID=1082276 RepID=A0A4R1QZB0_HYDET|nr:OPT/YSL family transporter [Hydrogenispora ethanolica]TCL58318.1 putative OPT family oligopeptide transporter [Hydrogenispora ethanolica]